MVLQLQLWIDYIGQCSCSSILLLLCCGRFALNEADQVVDSLLHFGRGGNRQVVAFYLRFHAWLDMLAQKSGEDLGLVVRQFVRGARQGHNLLRVRRLRLDPGTLDDWSGGRRVEL